MSISANLIEALRQEEFVICKRWPNGKLKLPNDVQDQIVHSIVTEAVGSQEATIALLKEAKDTLMALIQNQKNHVYPADEIEKAWAVQRRVYEAWKKASDA